MTLSIVIVNYNSKDFVMRCIDSIKKFYAKQIKNKEYEIVIVDNGSKDGSQEALKKVKSITFIPNKENLGFSKGNNIGIRKTSGKYVLFLNPDTEVNEKTLITMIDFMDAKKDAGAATCKVIMGNGKIDDAIHRGFPTPLNSLMYFSGLYKVFPNSLFFNGYHLGWKDMDKIHEIDSLAGAFMIVRRLAGEQVGWWDEDYFFYGEDIDFCFRLKQAGWKIFYVPTATVFHHKGVSGGIREESKDISTADMETKRLATNWRYKAMEIFYDKHYKGKYPFFINFAVKTAIKLKLWKSLRDIEKTSFNKPPLL